MNLDPLGEHDDAALNSALHAAGLFTLQGKTSGEGGQITLDTMLASGGANLSLGQRQILALSRALIRGSKILILDEGQTSIILLPALVLTTHIATSAIGERLYGKQQSRTHVGRL
jgi:ABC-type multidrug transport system fused ATPase/permease subunit